MGPPSHSYSLPLINSFSLHTLLGLRYRPAIEQIKQHVRRDDKSSRYTYNVQVRARLRDERSPVIDVRLRSELKQNRNRNRMFGEYRVSALVKNYTADG